MKRPDDPPDGEPVPRRAARVILRDAARRVLLIRYNVAGYVFWATPGGAVETGETDRDAATRELMEELRLTVQLAGPVHRTTGRFHHEGRYVESTEIFFTAVVGAPTPDGAQTPEGAPTPGFHGLTGFEAAAVREVRWWSLEDVDTATGNIFPRDLGDVLRRLQAADQ